MEGASIAGGVTVDAVGIEGESVRGTCIDALPLVG